MKASTPIKIMVVAAASLLVLTTAQTARAQTLLLQLKSPNYNPTTGAWADSSGNGNTAQASGTYPTVAASASPNGSPAVVFNGGNTMTLATSIAAANGYTAFAYVEPSTTSGGPYAMFGGTSGSFEYRINAGKQNALKEQQAQLGVSVTTVPSTSFSLIDVTITNTGAIAFRFDGTSDGTASSAFSLSAPISAIGSYGTGSGHEYFNGSICEIDIYAGVLTPTQITNIEAAITASYVTPLTGPVASLNTTASPATATVGGNDTLSAAFTGAAPISYQWFVSPNANGSGATSITGATNTTLVLSNLQLSASGKYYTLEATNNVSPYTNNSGWLQLNVVPLTPMVQLIATNYDGSSVWTDTSGNGNNATYSGSTAPTLAPFVTPNGGSAVNISSGSGSFVFGSTLAQGSGYTVFAYVEPSNVSSGRHALTGGSSSGALEYDFYGSNQDYLREYLQDVGNGTNVIPTSSFSLVDLAVNSSGGAFRLNGSPDGAAVAGATFSSPIARVGNNEGGGDGFVGNIAEIDVYSGALTYVQVTNIEAQLTARYVTASSIVIGPATVSPTNNTYAGNPITLSASVIGGTGTTTYRWQTDNGSGGSSFANIPGATSTNYVLNTSSLLGSYEYQLIGTPFGGSSVTSAPVTLNVQAATAPVILSDTAANPTTATVGGNDTFSASFGGNLPIGYQWQVSSSSSGIGAVNIPGATNTSLTLSNLQLSGSGNYYSLRATNTVAPYVVNSTWLQLNVTPLTALVQLIATNYDGSSVWTDSSGNGNNATYFGSSAPTLTPFVTPNGGSAVTITNGGGSFLLTSPLDPSVGYTVFAYYEPSSITLTQNNAITGGSSSGALEYHIHSNQVCSIEYVVDVGHGTNAVPTNNFSLLDLAINSSGGSFRFNGATDATIPGATFTSPITRIGNNEGSGDSLLGQVAEIDIYSGVLSYLQITNIEAQLTAKYITSSSIAIGPATVSPTNNTYAGNPIILAAPVIGGTGTTTYRWQTDNGSGGSSFANIPGATSTNYVLNTSSLLGSYEYQLVGTPFGGSSVTSAPVTLNVQTATAPVVVNDTAANPSTATVGGNDTLSASFTGNLPIGYQWQVSSSSSGIGAVNIPGATNTSLTLSNLQLSGSGNYYSLRATNTVAPYVVNSTWLQLNVTPLTALVQLIATNYDAVSGIWTDTSGNGNNATYNNTTIGASNPTLDTLVTPAGGSAVDITSAGGSFLLTSPLDPSSGYTVVAYVEPASVTGGNRHAITGGSSSGALEYTFYQGNQNYLIEYVGFGGYGIATVPTSGFSMVDIAVNSSGAAFRFNGAPDGNVVGATFSSPITRIGNNEGSGDSYVGDIAEIDIYSGALSLNQVTNLEAQLTAEYGTVGVSTTPVSITATVVGGNTLKLIWPADHTGWTLQAQTNSLSTGLGNNWVNVPNSTTTDTVTVPIVPGNPTVFYRLKH